MNENIYPVKIWYSRTRHPLLKLDNEAIKRLPIDLNNSLLVVIKKESIEIFNAEFKDE